MRQSKSLGSLALPVGNALKRKSTPRDTSEQYFPAAADAYELLEDCGRGVSATVWRARCLVNTEIVAVKIMDLEAQMAPLQDIIHEAQTMKAYKHEAILGLHVCFVHQTHLWMVMPYMEGGSVAHIMRYRYPDGLQEPVIATIMKEVLSALAYIHSHGDIHRDVKAGNILVDGEGHVKLGDFGVAASMERQDWGAPQGRNTFAGTPCWMAPEVLEQADRYGPKADIWSAGITMLELVHGHAPFSKLPPIKVLLLTLQGPPPQLEAECGGRHFSRGMREVVASCLNKDPAKRPTAKQLLSKGFFRQAKDAEYIKRTILAGLPPLPQRCMEIRMGKGRAATLAFENDRAAMASHISYITDVAQWDFNCTKSSAAMESGTANSWSSPAEQATAAAAATAAATASSSSLADSSSSAAGGGGSSSPSKAVSSRGDQQLDQPQLLQQQSIAGTGPGANGVASALGSSTSLDVPGQQHQQGVVGLDGFMSQQQQRRQQLQVAGDVGPGARDVDTSSGGVGTGRAAPDTADAAEKVLSPVWQPHSPRVVQAPAAVGAGFTAAGSPADATASARSKVLTCFAGGRTITTFPVSVPDTPDHSPMHSRPSTPEVQAAAGAADTGRPMRPAAVSYPGAAAAGAIGAAIPGAKKHGRFTYVEGSTRYQGPELVSDSTKAAAAAAAGGAPGGSAVPGVKGYELLKQRSVSSPDMALLMSLQGAPRSSLSSNASAAGSSALSDTPVSPVSPVSPSSAFAPADAAAAAAAAAVSSGDDVSPGHLEQQPQWDLLSPTAVAAATVATAAAAAAGASSPRGRPSSPAAGSGTGLFAKLLPHKTGDAGSPRRPQSPVGSQQQHEHHEQHHLQHKLAGFFAHHGLGKGSKGASPLSSRDASPHVSRHSLLDPSNVSAGSSRPSSSGLAPAVAAGSGGAGDAVGSSSNAAAGMGSLSRSGAALQDIYHENYSSRDASKSPHSHSPRAAAGHGRAAAGQKEHATAAQIWQHVKEACAETASDVAHIFRSRSGGSLHSERGSSHSPERPQQQQQHPPVSPPSPRLQLLQPHKAEAQQQQQQQQAAALPAAAAAAIASKASNSTSSPTAATASNIATTPVAAAAAAAAAAAFGAGPVVGRTASSSNLVRLGSRGSIPAVSLAEMGSGGSSTSKPPRYQPAKAASTEQLVKQPLSPPRQPPQQQQPQLDVASEPQVALKPQQLLSQQQEEVQQELLQMQQQPGIPEDEVTEAAAAVTTLAAAADAVEQAAAAAAAAGGDGGVPGGVDAASVSPPAAGGKGSTSPQAATSSSRGMGVGVSDIQHPASTSPGAAVTDDGTRLAAAAAAVPGLSELGSRELSFAQQRSGPPQTCGSGDSSTAAAAAAAAVAANRLSSHALDSPERKQGETAAGLVQESSVTFPVMARLSGDSQTESPPQQQQQQQRGLQGSAGAGAATTGQRAAGAAHPTLLELRAVDSTEDNQQHVRGRALLTASDAAAGAASRRSLSAQQQQRNATSAEPRSAHTSASPSRRHKGRFTIIET